MSDNQSINLDNMDENIVDSDMDETIESDIDYSSEVCISCLHTDRLVSIMNLNRYDYFINYCENNKIVKNEKKSRIDFSNQKNLLKLIIEKKIDYTKVINRLCINKKLNGDIVTNILVEIFKNCNIDYNDKIITILTMKKIKLSHIKQIISGYAENVNKDILLWNYLINNIILYESNEDIKFWELLFKKAILDPNFYNLFTDFIYADDIMINTLKELIINGKIDIYNKICKIYKINKKIVNQDIFTRCINKFSIHQSYDTIKYCLENIRKVSDDYLCSWYIRLFLKNIILINDSLKLPESVEKTLIEMHNYFNNQDMTIKSTITDTFITIPVYLLENKIISFNLIKYYYQYISTDTDDNDYNIYHILADINYSYMDINEYIKIWEYLIQNTKLNLKRQDENNITPFGYIVKNQSLNYEVIKLFLRYYSFYDKFEERDYLYSLLVNYNITYDIIYKLIINKDIDVNKLNDLNENILMVFAQNLKNLNVKMNKELIKIYKLLIKFVDSKQKDVDGNNVLGCLMLLENYELMNEIIPILGNELLNDVNNKGITPLFRLCKYSTIKMYKNIFDNLISKNVKMDLILKYDNKQKSILEHVFDKGVCNKLINYLLEKDRDNFINYKNKYNEDHIVVLMLKGYFDVNSYKLLNKYIDYNKLYWEYYDIFLIACKYCKLPVIKKMIQFANLNHINDMKENCILSACYNFFEERYEIIKYLINYGVNYKVKNINNWSLYRLLIHLGFGDVLDKLIMNKVIDIYDNDFIDFVYSENIEKYKNQYNINQRVIEYSGDLECCMICKDDISEYFFKCLDREHVYHKECFIKWIEHSKKSDCLLCMKSIPFYKEVYKKI
jgi:hypothetical protein